MKILKMTESDLSSVILLAKQLGYPINLQDATFRFKKINSHSDYALFVAKSNSNEILGYIQVNKEPTSLLVDNFADIAALVVDENARGKGIGKELLNIAESWARENMIELVRVRSNIKRTDAHRFYIREGFETSKTANMFTKKILWITKK
jgi:GNAT superfamily N-acetyltransferase